MKLLIIFLIINLVFELVMFVKLQASIKKTHELIQKERIPEKEYRPPLDEEFVLSKQELEVLEGLSNLLNFDGTLPNKEDNT